MATYLDMQTRIADELDRSDLTAQIKKAIVKTYGRRGESVVQKNFADVRLAWNELGIGLQVEVRGKQELPVGNPERPPALTLLPQQQPTGSLPPWRSYPLLPVCSSGQGDWLLMQMKVIQAMGS